MTTKRTSKRQAEMAAMSNRNLADGVKMLHQVMADMARNGYADHHPAVVDMRKQLGEIDFELERRAQGGKVKPSIGSQMMTDGERLSLGLEPQDDAI